MYLKDKECKIIKKEHLLIKGRGKSTSVPLSPVKHT